MRNLQLLIMGDILSIVVGIARAFGGFLLIRSHSDSKELCIGIILAIIGSFLTSAGIVFLINMSQKNPKTELFIKILTVGIVVFWIDGIINGFLLLGTPQLSGQIINTSLLFVILVCFWWKRKTA